MARTASNMLALGTKAPVFELPDTISGKTLNLNELQGWKGTVVYFICNHCPFVLHVIQELVRTANDFKEFGVSFLAISSNDVVNYPQDAPDKMAEFARQHEFTFPYLYDETQQTAKAYDAACTPDIYLFNGNLELVYRGQIDDSRPGNEIPVTAVDLRTALTHLLAGKVISAEQKPSIGCGIKWKDKG
jgi:peroxiredoxin